MGLVLDPGAARGSVHDDALAEDGKLHGTYSWSVASLDSSSKAAAKQTRASGSSSSAVPPAGQVAVVAPESDDDETMTGPVGVEGFTPQLDGEALNFWIDEHGIPGKPRYYKRLCVRCPLADSSHWRSGAPCMKYRNIGQAQKRALGDLEPEAFLRVWAADAEKYGSATAHIRDCKPSEGTMRVLVASCARDS